MNDNTDSNTITNSIAKNKLSLIIDNNKNRNADVILGELDCYFKVMSKTAQSLAKSISENENKIKYFKQKTTKLDKLLANGIEEINNNHLVKSNRQLMKYKIMARDNGSYNQHVKDTKNNILNKIKTLYDNVMGIKYLRKQMNNIVHKINNNIEFRIKKGKEIEDLINRISDCFAELNRISPLTKSQDERAQEINKQCEKILFVDVVNMGKGNNVLKEENKKIEDVNNKSYKDAFDFIDKVAAYLNPISINDVLSNTTASFNCKTDISYDILFNRNITNGYNILIATTKH